LQNDGGVPVVLNTSFNIKGQPIVENPNQAISTFFGSGLDALLMGPFLITKDRQAVQKF
jgi:carbamoyltransferase